MLLQNYKMTFAGTLFLFSFACASISHAELIWSLNGSLQQDFRTLDSSDRVQTSQFDSSLYVQIHRSTRLYLGAEYLLMSSVQPDAKDGTPATFSSGNLLTGLKYYISRNKMYSLSAFGSPFLQGSYQLKGSKRDNWTGTGWGARFSIHPELSESLKLNVSLCYFSALYSAKNQSSGSASAKQLGRTVLMPSIGLDFIF